MEKKIIMVEESTTVTFGVIAYNEHDYLPDLLSDLMSQSYSHKLIEVILVDGNSTDDTWKIITDFQERNTHEFKSIKVLKNTKRTQPAGWNVVIKNCTGDILLRIDAHARLPKNFVEKNVDCIHSGENVCGGSRENIIDEATPWKKTLLMAEQSMFGSGIASYRHETSEKSYVKSIFHAAYKREVINSVGLFNEDLIRTEDNEYHYRVRLKGYQICHDPAIHSSYQTRSSLTGMLRQKFFNGYWVGRTLFVCPGCISLFHLVPGAFVLAILFTLIIGLYGIWCPAFVLWIAYGIANISMTIFAILDDYRNLYSIMLPIIFLLLHACYGIGTLKGLILGMIDCFSSIRRGR